MGSDKMNEKPKRKKLFDLKKLKYFALPRTPFERGAVWTSDEMLYTRRSFGEVRRAYKATPKIIKDTYVLSWLIKHNLAIRDLIPDAPDGELTPFKPTRKQRRKWRKVKNLVNKAKLAYIADPGRAALRCLPSNVHDRDIYESIVLTSIRNHLYKDSNK